MFCRNCGKEIDNDSAFCQFCGTSQNNACQTTILQNNISSSNIITKETKNTSFLENLNQFINVFGASVFFILLIAFVVFCFNYDSDSGNGTSKSNTEKSTTAKPDITIISRGLCPSEYGGMAACITVKNNSSITKTVYADVNIEQGNTVVDSTITNTLAIKPGQKGLLRAYITTASSGFSYKVHSY